MKDDDRALTALAKLLRWAELIGLYWLFPLLIDFRQRWQGFLLIPAMVATGAVLFVILWFDGRFDRRSLWNFQGFRKEVPRILVTSLIAFAFMLGLAWWVSTQGWAPQRLYETPDGVVEVVPAVQPLGFALRSPESLLVVCLLYPLLSVYPQEIILRTFFFHRYAPILGRGALAIVGSALTFAWVHVIFIADMGDPGQWIPVYLCVPAGLLFGYTYWKTKSTIASGFEHALVGNLMWTAGLGWFFFAGGAVANGG